MKTAVLIIAALVTGYFFGKFTVSPALLLMVMMIPGMAILKSNKAKTKSRDKTDQTENRVHWERQPYPRLRYPK